MTVILKFDDWSVFRLVFLSSTVFEMVFKNSAIIFCTIFWNKNLFIPEKFLNYHTNIIGMSGNHSRDQRHVVCKAMINGMNYPELRLWYFQQFSLILFNKKLLYNSRGPTMNHRQRRSSRLGITIAWPDFSSSSLG